MKNHILAEARLEGKYAPWIHFWSIRLYLHLQVFVIISPSSNVLRYYCKQRLYSK
jgi:hypothetical protein